MRRLRFAALFAALAIVTAACASDGETDTTATEDAGGAATEAESEEPSEMESEMESEEPSEMESEMESEEPSEDASMSESESASGGGAMTASGPGCAAIPADGEGSLEGMTDDPTATAASNNPLLSTLVMAVTQAGLVDTLNDPSAEFTVFAPSNDAFAKIPAETMSMVMADPDMLASILTLHVVPGQQLDSAALAEMESVPTVNGADITLAAEGDTLMVNGQASVVCSDVMTANSTVHVIDTVLMPAS